MATEAQPQERTLTVTEAEQRFVELLALVAAGVRVRITDDGREVCVMESPLDRNDRAFRDLKEREAGESDTPARLTRPQFFKD